MFLLAFVLACSDYGFQHGNDGTSPYDDAVAGASGQGATHDGSGDDTGLPATGTNPDGDTGGNPPDGDTPGHDTPGDDTGPGGDTGTGTPDAPHGCTGTVGYWVNHPELWPTDHLVLGARTYDEAQLEDILGSAPQGDVSIQLARQLIATKLAVSGGASDGPVAATVDAADQWLIDNDDGDGIPLDVSSGSDAGAGATDLIDALTDYNDGTLGIPHC